ncbi:MAG: sensor histidine kinase [Frankiales bacterium]|nr:sensor histidine kinase [Frankiales bacterium]
MRLLGDELLVRRASRGLALQAAGLVAAAMLLLVVLVTLVVVRGQQSATDTQLRSTVAAADDVVDPPAGSWILISKGNQVSSTPGLPGRLRASLAALRSSPTTVPVLRTLSPDDGGSYRVVTRQRAGQTVQVVLDLLPQHEERERLFQAMGVAGVLSLVVAALLGVLFSRRAVRPLAEALMLQRTFVADASHELRTPLTLLSTRVQVLDRELQGGTVDAQALKDSRGVVADVRRLGEVVEDLLVAADPRGDDQHESIDLEALVRDVATSAAAHAARAGVSLSVTDAGEAAPLTVQGIGPALRRAVLALVDNAIEHTPSGGRVELQVRRQRRDIIVTVRDTGPGIAPEAAERVLNRFHSGGQRAGRSHYGLGLALTHDVANRHGGQLRLAPSESGATFELVLPASYRKDST